VAGPGQSQIYPALEQAGIPVERLPVTGSITAWREDRRTVRALLRILREGDFDAAHAHGMKAGLLLRLAGKLTRVPVAYTPHCFAFISNEFRDDLRHPLLRRSLAINVERALGTITGRLICVSQFERSYADRLHIAPASRRRTIPNGVAMDRAAAPDPDLLAWRGDGLVFGAVSMLRQEKGLHHLIDVAALLGTEMPAVRLAIVGDGPEREDLAAGIQRAGVGDRIALFPFSGSSDPHLAALDGLLLPSDRFESLPIGVIEAMAFSLPVVGSRLGGVPELIADGESGVLVPPGNPEALAAAVKELASDSDRAAAMGRYGRRIAEERFSLERMINDLEREYLDLRRRSGKLSAP
jgi:glycosyltransferase involved in cell wall biosynthesis